MRLKPRQACWLVLDPEFCSAMNKEPLPKVRQAFLSKLPLLLLLRPWTALLCLFSLKVGCLEGLGRSSSCVGLYHLNFFSVAYSYLLILIYSWSKSMFQEIDAYSLHLKEMILSLSVPHSSRVKIADQGCS